MYQQQPELEPQPVYYANNAPQQQFVQVVPPPNNTRKSLCGTLFCYNFMIIAGLIVTFLGGTISVSIRIGGYSRSPSGVPDFVAHAVQIAFIPLATISLILTIGNCVAECILSKNGPRTRCRNIADIGCNVTAAVTLLLGSVMLIGGSVQFCEAAEEAHKSQPKSDNSLPDSCHLMGLTWVAVPAGVIGMITSFIFAGPIKLACEDLKKPEKERMNSAQEDLQQVQQGPPPYYSNDQPDRMYSVAPSGNPSYVQQQQQQVVYQPAPYYYADPNYAPPPPSYQTY